MWYNTSMKENENKRVFLSGGITGIQGYRDIFKKAEEQLRSMGYKFIMNPAVLPEDGFEYADYLNITKAMLEACDIVVFLPGWEKSSGSQTERVLAIERDMVTLYGLEEARDFIEGDLCTL